MPIIEEYGAIARRLRELQSGSPKSADKIGELETWRDLAIETARVYVENRRRGISGTRLLPRRRVDAPRQGSFHLWLKVQLTGANRGRPTLSRG